jgi:hypothetical protein
LLMTGRLDPKDYERLVISFGHQTGVDELLAVGDLSDRTPGGRRFESGSLHFTNPQR